LTVSTCYPFTFVGAAPERYVLVAYLVKSEPNNNENG
jgi:sortase A